MTRINLVAPPRWRFVATFVLALLMLSSCSMSETRTDGAGTERSGAREQESVAEALSALRGAVSFEFDPFESPDDMLAASQVAVDGVVVSVDKATQPPPEGEEDLGPTSYFIVGTRVERAWSRGDVSEGVLYWRFFGASNVDPDFYRRSLIDQRLLVFGEQNGSDEYGGYDPPSIVYSPWPQGLLIVEPDTQELLTVWGRDGAASSPSGWRGVVTLKDLEEAIGTPS